MLLPGAAAAEVTVAVLGDSLAAGYGLPPEEGLVPRLQAWLDEAGADVRLVNAGVSGDTTAGGLARLDWTLTEDVDALVVELGGNDYLRAIEPEVTRGNLDAILTAAGERGIEALVVGLEVAPNYGADWKAEFDAIFPELAEEHGALLMPDFFGPLTTDGTEAGMRFMQPDGIHPNAEGVALVVEALGPLVVELAERAS